MEKTKAKQPRRNDALQSGSGNALAFGRDARWLGEGGQTIWDTFDPGENDKPHRDPESDESVPRSQHPSRRKR